MLNRLDGLYLDGLYLDGLYLDGLYLAAAIALLPVAIAKQVKRGAPLSSLWRKFRGTVPNIAAELGALANPASAHHVSKRRVVWLHAVSVGEVNVLKPLVQRLQTADSTLQCVISTTTETGQAMGRQAFPELPVFYWPLDFSWAVRRALDRIQPDLIVLAELEVWPNFIAQATRRGIPVAVVNGRLSTCSYRGYRRLRRQLQSTFGRLSLVAAQNDEYARRFIDLGCDPQRVAVTGSVKFDSAVAAMANRRQDNSRLPRLDGQSTTVTATELHDRGCFRADDVRWVAGSTQYPEERHVALIYRRLKSQSPRLRLVLVPRHPHRAAAVARMLDKLGLPWRRISETPTAGADAAQLEGKRSIEDERDPVWIVDTVGQLVEWWSVADIAFVGGSFGNRGGQNMIEPASFGVPTAFGPNTRNFRDVVQVLLESAAAVQVGTWNELEQFARRCLIDHGWAQELGENARRCATAHRGAADVTVTRLLALLPGPTAKQRAA